MIDTMLAILKEYPGLLKLLRELAISHEQLKTPDKHRHNKIVYL